MNEGKQRDLENGGKLKIVIPATWTPFLLQAGGNPYREERCKYLSFRQEHLVK
ncbi:MAG: hypothetical protein JSW33_01265 [bacterium]|nr:MAG: hypothetical protein JSW33_01265 [bacterium]